MERPPLPVRAKYDPHFHDPWYIKFARVIGEYTLLLLAIAWIIIKGLPKLDGIGLLGTFLTIWGLYMWVTSLF